MPKLAGLIFDLDGTLLNSAPDLRQALNATLADFGHAPLDLTTVAGFTGDGLLPLLQRGFAAGGAALEESQMDAVYSRFIEHYRALPADPAQIYPHVTALLDKAKAAGLRLGVCTNKQESETHRLLEQIGLQSYFGFVAGGDTYRNHKPHPDPVRGVMQELGLTVDDCVMIGDSRNDVLSAQGAGIPCIGITHGYGSAAGLGADVIIGSFLEIPDALTQLGFGHDL